MKQHDGKDDEEGERIDDSRYVCVVTGAGVVVDGSPCVCLRERERENVCVGTYVGVIVACVGVRVYMWVVVHVCVRESVCVFAGGCNGYT